ncbi:MAG: hypothetical protein FWG70_06510 [Oscillospiraceae bacterium]|nr:hypothetical protein [Oscillospiraceae bacterium]
MNPPKIITYNVDEIHAMRLYKAEQRSRMTLEEGKRDFQKGVAEAKKTMDELRDKKQLSL